MIEPNSVFKYMRPDEVAECWNGVSNELYAALWNSMDDAKPLSEHLDIEESSPSDAVGLENLASRWDRFSEDQQRQLNELAVKNGVGV